MHEVAPVLIDDADKARQAMTPLRLKLLALLREPGSAATLAAALELPRQKIGYHLHALEKAGLVIPAGARQRRGFIERLFVARAGSFVVDPAILGLSPAVEKQDRFAAEHLVARSAETVREVTRMQAAAEEGTRLLTFTIEADIGFAAPQDVEAFAGRLVEMVAGLAEEFRPEGEGRRYRLLIGGHPAIKGKATGTVN